MHCKHSYAGASANQLLACQLLHFKPPWRHPACSVFLSEACFCLPAPHPQRQPLRTLPAGHHGRNPAQAVPATAHSVGPGKARRAVSLQPEELVPHLMPQSRRAAGTRKGGSPRDPVLPIRWKPAQSSLTLHGKYWSSRRPIPRHPRMFLPHTNSSPLSAKKEKWALLG